ncbi:uncharacterized protein JCM6883_002180 [Sporobolomyces salmoneus]|uniref:uncharacterized protein n=1 Tax=Sporobolomyces salmoneus TaxID=183962 RepID=UPI003182846B
MGFIEKIGQTVWTEIWPQTLFFTLVSVAITVGCETTGYAMKVNTIMLGILSTMLSFALSLRSSSALERWNSGRQAWTSLNLGSRNLAMLIWLHYPSTTLTAPEVAELEPGSEQMEVEQMKAMIEKRTMVGLIEAYAAAVKHYVRGESGIYFEDLYDLVAPLPKYSFVSSIEGLDGGRDDLSGLWRSPGPDGSVSIPVDDYATLSSSNSPEKILQASTSTAASSQLEFEKTKPTTTKKVRLAPAYNPPKRSFLHYAPVFRIFKPMWKSFLGRASRPKNLATTNVPLEISMFLSGYLAEVMRRKTIEATLVGPSFAALNQLSDALAVMERVLSTPLPFAYNIHLRAVTYVFLLLLPFQIYASLGYLTIVAEFVSATVFLGFLELGRALEQPFGYDASDLDLDAYCTLLARELHEITAHPQPAPSTFVWSTLNKPFLPVDDRSGTEILAQFSTAQSTAAGQAQAVKGVPGLKRFIAKNYHDLEERARKDKEERKRDKSKWCRQHQTREISVCSL